MRSVSKSSTPAISKLNDTLHAILKEAIPSGLFQLPVSSRQQGELWIVIGMMSPPSSGLSTASNSILMRILPMA
jgi:hypothetical protein